MKVQNEKTILYKNGKSGITTNPYVETEFDVVLDGGKQIHVLIYGFATKKDSFDNIDVRFLLNGKEINFRKDLIPREQMMLAASCQARMSHLCEQAASLYQQLHGLPESEMWM